MWLVSVVKSLDTVQIFVFMRDSVFKPTVMYEYEINISVGTARFEN